MCLLMVANGGHTPNRDDLERACVSNPDGFGYAVVGNGEILTGKGMTSKEVLDEFYRVRGEFPDRTCLFHARIGTHGVRSVYNVHPFAVDEGGGIVLAHNGILPVVTTRGKKDNRSDTRIFAEDYMEGLGVGGLDNPQIFDMLEKFIGKGNKIAVLNVTGELEQELYILNYDCGFTTDDKAIWWSNRSFEKPKPVVAYTPNTLWTQHGTIWESRGSCYVNEDGFECSYIGDVKPKGRKFTPRPKVPINQGTESGVSLMESSSYSSGPKQDILLETFERSADEDCPRCGKGLTGYAILHEICDRCFLCLNCKEELGECRCVGADSRSSEDMWWLARGFEMEDVE